MLPALDPTRTALYRRRWLSMTKHYEVSATARKCLYFSVFQRQQPLENVTIARPSL